MLLTDFVCPLQVSYGTGYFDDPVVTASTEFELIKHFLQELPCLFCHDTRFPDSPVSHMGIAEHTKRP